VLLEIDWRAPGSTARDARQHQHFHSAAHACGHSSMRLRERRTDSAETITAPGSPRPPATCRTTTNSDYVVVNDQFEKGSAGRQHHPRWRRRRAAFQPAETQAADRDPGALALDSTAAGSARRAGD